MTRNPTPTRIQDNDESSSLTRIQDVRRNPNPTRIEDPLTYNGSLITWACAKKMKKHYIC